MRPVDPIRFGPFEADPSTCKLRRNGRPVRLQHQPFELLLILLENGGKVVTREEIYDRLWGKNTFVDFEPSLNTAIGKLRRALGDSVDRPVYIQTVPKVGYRFGGPSGPAMDTAPPVEPRFWRRPERLYAACAMVAVAVVAVIGTASRHTERLPWTEKARRYAIPTERHIGPRLWGRALISPDGNYIAYATGGSPRAAAVSLWLQDLHEDNPICIAGPGRLSLIAWAPDSGEFAYTDDGVLYRLAVSGGQPVLVADLDFPFSEDAGGWRSDGRTIIMVAPAGERRIVEVDVRTGGLETVMRPEDDGDKVYYRGVHYLPMVSGKRRILLREMRNSEHLIVAADLDSGERKVVTAGEWPFYSPSGHILYQAPGGLWALPFSVERMCATGEPVLIRETGQHPSVSQDGTLVYIEWRHGIEQLVWKNRNGGELGTIGRPQQSQSGPVLSPDGERVAVSAIDDGPPTIWIHDTRQPTATRATFTQWNTKPNWHPDGERIFYSSVDTGYVQLTYNSADGLGIPQSLEGTPYPEFGNSWTKDGRYHFFTRNEGGLGDIWYWKFDADNNPVELRAFLATEFDEHQPAVSPDGQLVAYSSERSGRHEVYIRTFPSGEQDLVVSIRGGTQPRWRGDGKELYYVDPIGDLYAVPVSTSTRLSAGSPQRLFSQAGSILSSERDIRYDVSPDGRRFVVIKVIEEGRSTIRVVDNWFAELRALETSGTRASR